MLSVEEKVIGSKLVSAFGQTICGFDVLRSIDGNFVCDVNGSVRADLARCHADFVCGCRFSFVKKNKKYYDDTVWPPNSLCELISLLIGVHIAICDTDGLSSWIPINEITTECFWTGWIR